ncbi:MAG TPA: hypothetical protein VLI04_11390 [Nocardioidaceae bacterium]|nr:hypothetical protein [Nocardioidaceae bacterium]
MSIDRRIREGLRTTNDELPLPDVDWALAAVTAGGRPTRRRKLVAGLAVAAAAAAVAVVLVVPSLIDDDGAPSPAPSPTPSLTPLAADGSIYFAADGGAGAALTDPLDYVEVELNPHPMDIYLSRHGQPVRRIIATGAHERCPVVSPDGARLAYLAGPSIVIVPLDADGNPGAAEVRVDLKPQALYRPSNTAGPACPQWSPDGRRLGYLVVGYDSDGVVESIYDPLTAEVHAVTLDGKDSVLVAFDRMSWNLPTFAWSPDSDEVAYTTTDATSPYAPSVWRARLDGVPELVWRTPEGHLGPQGESRDGPISLTWSSRDELAFTLDTFLPTEPNNPMSGGSEQLTVMVIDPRSGEVRLETAAGYALEGGAGERWSPDGSLLVFAGPDGRILLNDRATGSTVRLRLPFEGTDGGYAPTWSPDGQELLARVRSDDRGFALASFAIDGSSSEVRTPWTWALDWTSLDDVDWGGR